MIFGNMDHIGTLSGMPYGVYRVLSEVYKYGADNFPEGQIRLDGERLYMNFAKYNTSPRETAKAEAHRKYIDVMYMVEGEETVYVKSTDALTNITMEYDAEGDALLADLDPDVSAIRMTPGSVLILYPSDAHAPGCVADAPSAVKKIIGKVLIDF